MPAAFCWWCVEFSVPDGQKAGPFPIFRKCFQNHGKILLRKVVEFSTKSLLSYDLSKKSNRGTEIAYRKGAHP